MGVLTNQNASLLALEHTIALLFLSEAGVLGLCHMSEEGLLAVLASPLVEVKWLL